MIVIVCLAALAACLLAAAWSDLRRYVIPNPLALAVAALGLLAVMTGGGLDILPRQAGIALALFAAGAALFFARLWGAGDAKLLAALGLWVPPSGLATLLLWTALSGGLLALALIVARRLCPANPWNLELLRRDRGVPYAVAIGIGMAAVILTHRSVITDTYFMG